MDGGFMKARKIFLLGIVAVMTLSLALVGCGGGNGSSTSNETPSTPTETPSTNETPDPTPAAAKFMILNEQVSTEQYGIGFRLDDSDLRDAVEYTIVEMYKDGTVEQIAKKYADQGISMEGFILTSTSVSAMPALDIKTFTVGFDQGFPPYGYLDDNGEFAGFDLDLAAEVAQRNGWELRLQPINWDFKDAELNSGNIDCVWNGFTITAERELTFLFTKPYMDNSQVIVVRADSGITTFADLADKVVMAQAASTAYLTLTDPEAPENIQALLASFKELRTIPEYNSAFLELEQGTVDAVAVDMPVAVFQINSRA